MTSPAELRYTVEHEWVRHGVDPAAREAGAVIRVGITDFAQQALGDIVYVSLPAVGEAVVAGDACGELESTKSVSDVYVPVSGTVVAVNAELEVSPEQVNLDPYGDGWLFDLQVSDPAQLDGLLDAAGYEATLA